MALDYMVMDANGDCFENEYDYLDEDTLIKLAKEVLGLN